MSVLTEALDIAVIGAGLAGVTCAQGLAQAGRRVALFDKSRGVGGRMATRRGESVAFDHGAQYFTARDAAFVAQVASWQQQGVVATWEARIAAWDGALTWPSQQPRYVAVPGMSALCRHAMGAVTLHAERRLLGLQRDATGWCLSFAGGELHAQQVVLALPAPQAAVLLPQDHRWQAQVAAVEMSPSWTVLLHVETSLLVQFDGCFINTGPLGWIARNNSKPGRPTGEAWVLQATPAWSTQHLEATPQEVIAQLLAALGEIVPLAAVADVSAHRWRYALAHAPLGDGYLWGDDGLGLCGDWLHGSRVEGAWLSGRKLSAAMR